MRSVSPLAILKDIEALNEQSKNSCKLKPGILYILIKLGNTFKLHIKYVHLFNMQTFKLQ